MNTIHSAKCVAFVLAVSLAFFQGKAVFGQNSKASIDVVGISIVKSDPDNQFGGSAVPGRQAGVEVTLRVVQPDAFVIGIVDSGKSKTQVAISAGKGKELKSDGNDSHLSFMSNISEDGHTVIIPVNATEIPEAGTTKLKVTGNVVLKVGSEPKSDKTDFKVAQGEVVMVGNVKAKIISVEPDSFGEDATVITFESSESFDAIRETKFLNESGKEIESSVGGSSSFGFGDQMTYSRAYRIPGKPQKLQVETNYFKSSADLSIPVEIELDFGLSTKK